MNPLAVSYAESRVLWDALAQYVDNGRDALAEEVLNEVEQAKLTLAESLLERMDAEVLSRSLPAK